MSPLSSRPPLSRRHLLQGFAAVATSSVLSGCGSTLYRTLAAPTTRPLAVPRPSPTLPVAILPPTAAPPPIPATQPIPSGPLTPASLTITTSALGNFGPGFVGLSYEKQVLSSPLFTAANTDLIGLFKRLGSGVLRIGGDSVDRTVWTPDGTGQTSAQTSAQIAPADVNGLAAFLQATGWTCIYGINLGGSATGATTPTLAAAEVSYVAEQLGTSLVGIELGNECETYGNPGSFYPYNWTVQSFESLWMQYRDSILEATPGAPLTGPASASNVDGWAIPFGEYVTRGSIHLLTHHYDRGNGSSATAEDLVSPDAALAGQLLQLKYGAESIDVPFRIDQCSAYSGGGIAGISDTFASSLWAIDMVFNCALGGATGINFQSGNQTASTPIPDNQGLVLSPQPLFYGLLLASMAGQGTLLSTQLSAASLNVTTYAIQTSDGGLSLLIVNKDATQNLDLSITLPAAMTSASLQALTQLSSGATSPSLTALSGITLQGATVAADGTFNPSAAYALNLTGQQLTCYIPALSAVLIQLT